MKRRLVVIGSTGRMGGEIISLAPEFGFRVVAGVARNTVAASTIKSVTSIEEIKAAECDVVIDFSQPEAMSTVLAWCVRNRRPLVSGVTGISERERAALKRAGKKIPILWAPNMSLGMAVLARMMKMLSVSASALEDFDFQIEEIHHRRKKDRPSGTAKLLQEQLEKVLARKLPPPLSIRGGGVVGVHRVWAMGEDEVILLEHTALNRGVFARGALRAAAFVLEKSPGLYVMDDAVDFSHS